MSALAATQPFAVSSARLTLYARCLQCGQFDSLDLRFETCPHCLSATLEAVTTRHRSRRQRYALTLSAWLPVVLSGLAWLGGAALLCLLLFALVPLIPLERMP